MPDITLFYFNLHWFASISVTVLCSWLDFDMTHYLRERFEVVKTNWDMNSEPRQKTQSKTEFSFLKHLTICNIRMCNKWFCLDQVNKLGESNRCQ